jgi:toxin ParE1/3/4
VNYQLHPDAALEHEEQVAYYEDRRVGLGTRYHAAMIRAIARVCETPHQLKIVRPPNICKVSLQGFPYAVIYRAVDSIVQVLAVAHHRRDPSYWQRRT